MARIFGIYPQKGHIAAGSDADVIIFDPAVEHTISAATHHSAMDTNIYEGMKIKGKVRLQPRVINPQPRCFLLILAVSFTLQPRCFLFILSLEFLAIEASILEC